MVKITKNSELAETSSKVILCEDPREAWIEISSGKYDDHFLRLATIYFADVYKNTNDISLDGLKVRQMFLENFDFRKSLIEFGKKKGLGLENLHVRNMMTHQMNFEGEDIDKIKKDYANQVKEIFFKDKKPDKNEVSEVTDPILLLLQEEDRQKVILSKRYGGDMKTFTRLYAILQFADAKEQKDILKYLVSTDLKKIAKAKDRNEIIDIAGDGVFYSVYYRPTPDQHLQSAEMTKKYIHQEIISHVISKDFAQQLSYETISMILRKTEGMISHNRNDVKIDKAIFMDFVMRLLNSVEIVKDPIDEKLLTTVRDCLRFIGKCFRCDSLNFTNKNIDFDFLQKHLNKEKSDHFYVDQGIEGCKESIEKKEKA